MSHSLKIFGASLFFLKENHVWLVFFFPPTFGRIFVFFIFPGKVYIHSLTRLKIPFFFFRGRKKKKTGFLLTHSIFPEKSQKTNYSREKKKKTTPLIQSRHNLAFGMIFGCHGKKSGN